MVRAAARSPLSSLCGVACRCLWQQSDDTLSSLYSVRLGWRGVWGVKGFFLASWTGRMMGGGPDGQRWGVSSMFVHIEGSKHQVRHNTVVWALGAAWLCMGGVGGHG